MSDPAAYGIAADDYVPPRKYRVALHLIDDATGEVLIQDSRLVATNLAVIGFRDCLEMLSMMLMKGSIYDVDRVKREMRQMAEDQQ